MWWSSSKKVPKGFHSLCMFAFVQAPPLNKVDLSDQDNIMGITEWDFQGSWKKLAYDWSLLDHHSLWRKLLPRHEDAHEVLGEAHVVGNRDLLPISSNSLFTSTWQPCWKAFLKVDLPVQLSELCHSGWHLDCNPLKDPKPESLG